MDQDILEAKPFLRWAGSKKKLLPVLSEYWNLDFKTYFEPFVGSGQLYFLIHAKKAILSDTNYDLINAYRVIKEYPRHIHRALQKMPVNQMFFNCQRSIDLETLNDVERAARFIYLNRFCFNGLYRTNLAGQFNVPFAPQSSGSLPNLESLIAISRKLENTKLIHEDFETVLKKKAKKGDFVYLDPPYSVKNRRLFTQYGPETFGMNDLNRLANLLFLLDERGVNFMLSYAYCNEALVCFKRWQKRKVFTQRNISGFADKRRKAAEVIFTNIKS